MSILVISHDISYTRKYRPDFWTTSIDYIGKTIVADDSIVVHRGLTIESYLEIVGEALYEDTRSHSGKYMGNTELIYETPLSSYYMMYIDPCYSKEDTMTALANPGSKRGMNEIASLLSPLGVGVFGFACLVKIDIDDDGKESIGVFDRSTLAHVIDRRLNHTAVEVVTAAANAATYREVAITNDLSSLFSAYKSYRVETNEFGYSYLCLGDNINDSGGKCSKMYIACLNEKKTAIGDIDKEHLKQMLELEAGLVSAATETAETTDGELTETTIGESPKRRITEIWNKLPELRNTSAKIRLMYRRYISNAV